MLKRKISKVDFEKLPDAIKGEYTLNGEEATLEVDGPGEDDVAEVLRAKENEKTARQAAEKKLKDAEKAAKDAQKAADLASGDVEKIKATLESEYSEKLKTQETRVASMRAKAEQGLLESTASTLAAKVFGDNVHIGQPHIEKRLKAVWDDEKDELKLVVLDKDQKPTTVEKLTEEFLTAKEFSAIVKGTGASGARPGPNGGPVGPGGSFKPDLSKGPPSRADFIARAKAGEV